MTFPECTPFLAKRVPVRRSIWMTGTYLIYSGDIHTDWPAILCVMSPRIPGEHHYYINKEDIEATDWEVMQ